MASEKSGGGGGGGGGGGDYSPLDLPLPTAVIFGMEYGNSNSP